MASGAFRYPSIRPDMPAPALWAPLIDEAYANGWFTNFGPLSRRLEAAFATHWGGRETACVAASSATAGLAAPLIANAIDGRVLLPAFTFPATLSAVKSGGRDADPDGCRTPRLDDCAGRA